MLCVICYVLCDFWFSMEEQNQAADLTSQISDLEKKCDEYLNGWKRAQADLINYKKDEQRRFEEIIKFSNQALITELLAIIDNFDLAISALEKQAVVDKGIYMIKSQLVEVLKKSGLEKLKISIGDSFDPALHEAIASVESEKPPDTILEEVEAGYLLHGKLIRPARVKVSKSKSNQGDHSDSRRIALN